MSIAPKITPVILSGGAGTRLWPMSRPERPKQFLALTDPMTMFELTVERVADSSRFTDPIVVANAAHADLVEAQLGLRGRIILEPCARNTAPAIALAAFAAPDDLLLVLPSDHVIADNPAFQRAIDAALPHVRDGWLATFGITPTKPETGYGYIAMGRDLGGGVAEADRFVEKPDAVRAAEMLADGRHVWNGGIFLFRAAAFLNALAAHAPDIFAAAQTAWANRREEGRRAFPDGAAFAASPSDSIDYAVMERADRVAVAPVAMGWSDVGSWDALHELGGEHDDANAVIIDGSNCLIRSDGVRIHTVGVSDLIIIASGNDILIVPRGQSQDVKRIVEALKDRDTR